MGRPIKKVEELYEPMPKINQCKHCLEEINLAEWNCNGGYCTDCYEDVLKDFGEDSNGTY